MNDETDQMKDLARKLYQQHSQVLNFIWEHGADSEFRTAVEVVTGKDKKFPNEFVGGAESGDPTYIYCKCNDRRFSFIPKSWYAALGNDGFTWPGCERWWAGYPVICWIEIYKSTGGKKGELRIFAEIGPISVLEFRKQLIHKIKESAQKNNDDNIKFNQGADRDSSKYSKFFKNGILHISDVHDQEEIANGIKTLMKKFKPSFDSVGSVLPEFLENGNPTTSDAV